MSGTFVDDGFLQLMGNCVAEAITNEVVEHCFNKVEALTGQQKCEIWEMSITHMIYFHYALCFFKDIFTIFII